MIINTGLFYVFPLGGLCFVWFLLPVLFAAFFALIFKGLVLQGQFPVPAVTFSIGLYIFAFAPITVLLLMDFFRGYFAGLFAICGWGEWAQSFLKDTQLELDKWEQRFA